MGNESTTRLVGENPNGTNQPTNDQEDDRLVFFCHTTGLYYLRSEPLCEDEELVGRFSGLTQDDLVVQFTAEDWDAENLRRKLKAGTRESTKLRESRDMAVLESSVYHDLAQTLEGERDRARDTAAALEEELHAAKLNLAHIRMTLALNDLYIALHLHRFPPRARQRLRQAIGSHCEVCTPRDDPFLVVESNHPDLAGERQMMGE